MVVVVRAEPRMLRAAIRAVLVRVEVDERRMMAVSAMRSEMARVRVSARMVASRLLLKDVSDKVDVEGVRFIRLVMVNGRRWGRRRLRNE